MKNLNKCPGCDSIIPESNDFCVNCGSHRAVYDKNYCINKNCERYKVELDNPMQDYCGKCGKLTVFGTESHKYI